MKDEASSAEANVSVLVRRARSASLSRGLVVAALATAPCLLHCSVSADDESAGDESALRGPDGEVCTAPTTPPGTELDDF
ncbi:MAG TPA: hypothetical protein VM580_32705, partial [Labilithrix sp.]|nr:hypothetical protein [Labilithrix sp.]